VYSNEPDLSIARGCCLWAAKDQGLLQLPDHLVDAFPTAEPLVTTITPYDLATTVLNNGVDELFVMVPKGSKIPAKFSQNFQPKQPNQKAIRFDVIQADSEDRL
jgi:hypothetical protein